MARIILIETSTSMLSTALAEDGKIVSYKESAEPRQQASLTAVFVQEMLDECGLKVKDCDAVCVSKGPGSYTGLRVGVSTAKGLCFGAGIPLLSVGTMEILVHQAIDEGLLPEGCSRIIPMIDARRMEVYSAVFSATGERLTETAPVIVDGESFRDSLATGPCLFIGDGALKCRGVITGAERPSAEEITGAGEPGSEEITGAERVEHKEIIGAKRPEPEEITEAERAEHKEITGVGELGSELMAGKISRVQTDSVGQRASFVQVCPKASAMLHPALDAFASSHFEDTAYFEPFYLKDFVATVSKKKLF